MPNRNENIEAVRVLLMFGIVAEHAISQTGCASGWRPLGCLLDSCVDGFMFISGYYGMRFRLSKILRLVGVVLFCGTILIAIHSYVVVGDGIVGFLPRLKYLLNASGGWWFLWAYLIVMFLSPLVEAAFDSNRRTTIGFVAPVLVLVFGWSYFTLLNPYIGNVIPQPAGFTPLSFLSLFGVYVFARALRRLDFEKFITSKVLIVIACVSAVFAFAGEWHHNSVPMLFLAMTWFLIAKRTEANWGFRLLAPLAPSMFSVYLLHSSAFGFLLLTKIERCVIAHGLPVLAAILCAAICVFAACIAIDFARRCIVHVFRSPLEHACKAVDCCYDELCEKITAAI